MFTLKEANIVLPVKHFQGTPTIIDDKNNIVAEISRWGTLLIEDESEYTLNEYGDFVTLAINSEGENPNKLKFNILPHKINFPVKYDSKKTTICDDNGIHIVSIRGWDRLRYIDNGEYIFDEIGHYIAKQMNALYEGIE